MRRRCKVAQSGECVEISRQKQMGVCTCVCTCVYVCVCVLVRFVGRARFAAQVGETLCHKKL